MSVFCPYRLPSWENEVQQCAWSKASPDQGPPVLAVIVGREVHLYSEEGERLCEPLTRATDHAATALGLEWQPTSRTLLTGWSSGAVCVVRDDGHGWAIQREASELHTAPICKLAFSPGGQRCVICSTDGLVSVWKTADSQFSPMCHYRKTGSHEHVAFRTLKPNGDTVLDPPFFFTGEKGVVYLGDDYGLCSERYQIKAPVQMLEYFHEKDLVVLVTKTMILATFTLDPSYEVKNEAKLKLSVANPEKFLGCWAGTGVLATCAGETLIRLWAIEEDEHYILPLESIEENEELRGDKAAVISYHPGKRTLAVGTQTGRILQWRCTGNASSEASWEPLAPISSDLPMTGLRWGPSDVLAAHSDSSVTVFAETELAMASSAQWVIVQKAASVVFVEHVPSEAHFVLELPFRVKGLSLLKDTLAVWSGKELQQFTLTQSGAQQAQHVSTTIVDATLAKVADETVLLIVGENKVDLCNLVGNSRQTLNFSELEGAPLFIDAKDKTLAIGTSNRYLRLYSLRSSNVKAVGNAKHIDTTGGAKLVGLKLSGSGSCVALTLEEASSRRKVSVYDTETDKFLEFNQEGRHVTSVLWENQDRLLALESTQRSGDDGRAPRELTTVFVRQEDLVVQERMATGAKKGLPCAFVVPHVYFCDVVGSDKLQRQVLADYLGLEDSTPQVLAALREFSFHLACGNTDEAHKCVEGLRSRQLWEALAKMCVKTRRIDVCEKCLSQMQHCRAAAALREAKSDGGDLDVQLAVCAVQLDLLDEAVQLLEKAQRYDLLNELYQACGEWDKAIQVAEQKDRIHLPTTYFQYAQHLESVPNIPGCMKYYELADAAQTEIPRVLSQNGLLPDLEQYVEHAHEPELHRWLAQYLESKSELENAAIEYRKAEDHLSLCRIACFHQDMGEAQRICQQGSKAASYHLARHLEASGAPKEAINYYALSGRLHHALRLAQVHQLDNELMHLALGSGSNQAMVQAARYCEQSGQPQKAVQLYHKAGATARALELCYATRQFDMLRKIAEDIKPDAEFDSPEVLAKCAEFLIEHQQHEKAVHILAMSKQYDTAIELCTRHNVNITEEMAERMTPDKQAMEAERRNNILVRVAKLLKRQGLFQLACKKFTQAGDKLRAMKALLQSGDTEKIIFFAGTARHPEVYVLAANYLQSLDWHDPEIMKNILLFYSKAKEFEKLASFYEACASVEIDEYRDYEKAAGALKEAMKHLKKDGGADARRLEDLQQRIRYIEKFAAARKKDGAAMTAACEDLLDDPHVDGAVRIGDIFALLVEYYVSESNFVQAYEHIEQMGERGIALEPYLDRAIVEQVYREVGQPLAAPDHGEDELEEEIEVEEEGRV